MKDEIIFCQLNELSNLDARFENDIMWLSNMSLYVFPKLDIDVKSFVIQFRRDDNERTHSFFDGILCKTLKRGLIK